MLRLEAQAGVRALTESVEDLSASLIEVKEAPTSVKAAVLSSSEDCGVKGARVASEEKISCQIVNMRMYRRTDGTGVGLNCSEQVSENTHGIGTTFDDRAGNGKAAKGNDAEEGDSHDAD